jgi:hypothetical protein
MAASINHWRPIAVALVIDNDGQLMLIGSKRIRNAEVEQVPQLEGGPWLGHDYTARMLANQTFYLRAECADLTMQLASPMLEAPPLAQQGIYLPTVSYRALLPSPDRKD